METLGKKFARWDLEGHKQFRGASFSALHQQLRFLARSRFDKYLVAADRDFEARLAIWINQVAVEADQRTMAEFASSLSFIGEDETAALGHSAFNGPITRWVIDQCKLDLRSPDFERALIKKRGKLTRYIAATDSMPIHEFYKITKTTSHSEKFNLKAFWKTNTMDALAREFQGDQEIERVVILEDFVGSGEQTLKMIKRWLSIFKKPTLFCPLIICPEGVREYSALPANFCHFSFHPVVSVSDSELLNANTQCALTSHDSVLKPLIEKLHKQVVGDASTHPPPYTPFGFPPPHGTGCRLVLRGNVPDNALPVIHYNSSGWSPLFPRKPREL